MAKRVVFAVQSPTLLNCLSNGPWSLECADWGDTSTLGEMSQLTATRWNGDKSGVVACFVCSPSHSDRADEELPDVPVFAVAHQGYADKLIGVVRERTSGVLCFSHETARFVRADLRRMSTLSDGWRKLANRLIANIHVVTPAYDVSDTWKWMPNDVWSMMSRPSTREPISTACLDTVSRIHRAGSGRSLLVYGQDQPGGLLGAPQKRSRMASCSAYLSCLPQRAGVGLAEHEAMSIGCPVVGCAWGDIARLIRHRDNYFPDGVFFDYGDVYGIANAIRRISEDSKFANSVSDSQKMYMRDHHSSSKMKEDIELLLWAIGA